ncbi:hypothetical protein HYPSUDRAFT_207723 [Hypholoma sublateritium FD-334 SS-4]|uniref:Uncharacterized protein n=1 Tax=Hypholoma sublateritium (strain FD-334 SS-4) TaxID=945553 RepID=A0A0D2LXM9_HYPSF|nr:hypothetical protein HYPSUDRAFT_207723 [Hypholoma sublateritium FD-334 SS-4]
MLFFRRLSPNAYGYSPHVPSGGGYRARVPCPIRRGENQISPLHWGPRHTPHARPAAHAVIQFALHEPHGGLRNAPGVHASLARREDACVLGTMARRARGALSSTHSVPAVLQRTRSPVAPAPRLPPPACPVFWSCSGRCPNPNALVLAELRVVIHASTDVLRTPLAAGNDAPPIAISSALRGIRPPPTHTHPSARGDALSPRRPASTYPAPPPPARSRAYAPRAADA